jgi:MFS family permease
MDEVRSRVGTAFRPVLAVFRNRNLRLMEYARATGLLATSGSTIVFVVVTYDLGGAGGVAALAVARLVVTAAAAPLGSIVGDRYDRQRVIVVADAARAVNLVGAAAAAEWSSSLTLMIVIAAVSTAIGMVSSPARAALMPSLAPTSDGLTAANVVAGATDNVATFVGPALAGVALAVTSSAAALIAAAVAAAATPVFVSRIRTTDTGADVRFAERARLTREALAGFRTVLMTAQARALLALAAVLSLVGGALTILFAVTAIHTLGLGSSGVGFLYSFFSAGAVVGSFVSVLLIGRSLETGIAAGALVWGLPLMAVAVWPVPAVAYVLFAVGGVGDTVANVASVTLLQRVIPRQVLSRSLGAFGFFSMSIAVLGSVLAPLVVGAIGARWALLAFGALVPVGVLPAGVWLRASARVAPPALDVLRDVALFAPLAPDVLEDLAGAAEEVSIPPNGVVFRAGDEGDRFYVVETGEVEISSDGRVLSREPRGGSFGEIALLREVPRTATATAPAGASLYAIDRETFINALTGHTPALEAAEALAASRLAATA